MLETPPEILMIKGLISELTQENKDLFNETVQQFVKTYADLMASGEMIKAGVFHMALTMACHELTSFVYRIVKEGVLDETVPR